MPTDTDETTTRRPSHESPGGSPSHGTESGGETFALSTEAAEHYETAFVPALFADWAPRLVELAAPQQGERVLDVACGTGIVARTVADALGEEPHVVGVDLHEAMLQVARRLRPDLTWRQGDVSSLPFRDGAFDLALCQSAMMFFPDPIGALREMGRVVGATGRLAVQVFGNLEDSPGYARFAELVARHAGPEAISVFDIYWVHGELSATRSLFHQAGLMVTETRTEVGLARFPSIDAFVTTEVESTPLLERIDAATYQRLRDDAQESLRDFETPDGSVAVPIAGHLIAARVASGDRAPVPHSSQG